MTAVPIPVPTPVVRSSLPGVNILVEGPTGTGKTTALRTLAEAGLEVFALFTESGVESLAGAFTDNGQKIPDSIHWHVLPRSAASFDTMAKAAEQINSLDLGTLSKIQDPNRGKHNQFISLLRSLSDFPCDRTGKKFGPVDSWGTGRVLAIDSLTGINPIALSLVVGGKPVRSQSDWGIAMDQIEKLIRNLCDGCRCHFVLTAHIERETDPVLGGSKITVSTLGRALAPKIPPMFSDVILSERRGKEFVWSTTNAQADLKARNLPLADNLPQDFAPIIKRWQSRGGIIEQS